MGGLLERVKRKYDEYGIDEKPFVIVKADAGTYGMGIMTVRDANDVVGLNRKQRNKMAVVKEGLQVESVIIQEGVPTFESIDDAIAEPVVYMVDRFVVGGFYRMHPARGKDENLNAPGAQFQSLAFEAPCIPDLAGPAGCPPNRFYAYGVVAQARATRGVARGRGARRRAPGHRRGRRRDGDVIPVEYCQLRARCNRWMNQRRYAPGATRRR